MNWTELLESLSARGVTKENKDYLVNAMLNGPPPGLRRTIWLEVTGCQLLQQDSPGHYAALLRLEPLTEESQAALHDIDKDINRTFPGEDFFDTEVNVQMLRNVLMAYALRNPTIGYCQGMNVIAGRLLSLDFTEEEVFWLFTQIIECYLPLTYFSSMSDLRVDQQVFTVLLQRNFPAVSRHLQDHGIEEIICTIQWFLCCFSYNFPKRVSTRIWDIFFVKGTVFLFQVGLALLYIVRKRLLQLTEFSELLTLLSSCGKSIQNEDLILSVINRGKVSASAIEVQTLREHFTNELYVNSPLDTALISYERCESYKSCKQLSRVTVSYLTFTRTGQFEVLENYVDSEVPKELHICSIIQDGEPLLRGARNHNCSFPKSIRI